MNGHVCSTRIGRCRPRHPHHRALVEPLTIPVPTMSIGIAVFPMETDKIIKLIDLADHRLYTAKERGRDQIEPAAAFWDELKKD